MEKKWELHHIAVIVRDIDKAVEYYQSLGIAKVGREVEFPEENPQVRAKFVEIGSVPIEFLQPLHGETPTKQYLDNHGEGIQHVAFAVDDLEGEMAKLVEKGVSVFIKGKAPAAFGAENAHFDTRQIGNFAIQLIQKDE